MTVMDEPVWRGKSFSGGIASLEAVTDTRWVTIRGGIIPYPF